ncbi:restriction endonuclease [Halobacillus rhizosphaerae]|uniref:restriction endonuclease n=1 Tax=Halobacillus rhizosphaerae TaxID=3064889 RepID=UPI00398B0D0F
MERWWMVRAGDNNELIPVWKKQGIASIGWPQLGDPNNIQSKSELIDMGDEVYEDSKPGSRNSWVNQVWRFSRDIKKGDKIITYYKETREYMVGTVTGEHYLNKSILFK